MEPGLYLVHKPVGATSFSLVRALKDEAEGCRPGKFPICHGGTLDPFAEGLVLLLAGQATRLLELFHALPKVYEAEIAWGHETDTCDPGGRVVAEGDAGLLRAEVVERALRSFLGWTAQIPPATCAKKIGGEPAYRKAHRGEVVVLPPSQVYLHEARWLWHELPCASPRTRGPLEERPSAGRSGSSLLWMCCRGGFYVRSLVRDLGRVVGCPAHVASLRRTSIAAHVDPPGSERVLVQGEALLSWAPTRRLTDEEADAVRQGRAVTCTELTAPSQPLPAGFPDPGSPVRALHRGRLVALLRESDEGLRPIANLRGGL